MILLRPDQRSKLDDSRDDLFYTMPRFVTHVDEGFVQRLTQLYRDRLPPGGCILDLMSSWVSHLPDDVTYERVEGHGLNAEELARNPRLDRYFVQNLNENPKLPLDDETFDGVAIAVSIQYLQYPEAIFAEIHRVLKPGGLAIASFSNRMFFQKAIQIWRDGSESDRVELVRRYFASVPGFGPPEVVAEPAQIPGWMQMLGVPGGDPFYAVLAERVDGPASEADPSAP